MSDCQHHDYSMVEDYIRGLQWSAEATDHEKSLVAGNIRGFYSHIRESLATRPAESVAQGGESDPYGWLEPETGNFVDHKTKLEMPFDASTYTLAIYTRPTPATGSGGEGRDLMLTVAEEWLAMHKEYVRASDFERWQYVPLVEDLIDRLAHLAPAGGDAGES